MAQPTPPTYEPPKSVPAEWTVDALKQHLQTACLLELHTIPLYLAAAYSIVGNDLAVYKIITVVKQEMLHLSLSGNLLCAIGGEPKIYGSQYTPHYPALIFYDKTQLDLKPALNATISTFRRIEQPLEPSRGPKTPEWLLPTYETIGQFYGKTMEGLNILYEQLGEQLFKPESIPRQFQTADGSWYDGDMTAITDINSARDALTLVIEQGEGSTGNVPIMNTIHTHYEIFKELEEWPGLDDYVSNVIENPVTEDLKSEEVYPVMKAGDAAYCYLLLSIEKAWTYAGPRRQELVTNNIMNLMLAVLKPMGRFLVQQDLQTGEELRAGLAFNLFEFTSAQSAYNELKSQMDAAVAKYPNAEELATAKRAVDGLVDLATLQ